MFLKKHQGGYGSVASNFIIRNVYLINCLSFTSVHSLKNGPFIISPAKKTNIGGEQHCDFFREDSATPSFLFTASVPGDIRVLQYFILLKNT